jgi:ABC-type protease/lipase transport system fused ATPase/permease subunit
MRYLSDVTNHFNCKKMIKDIIITIIFYFVFVLVVKPVSFWMLELIPIILSSNKELSLLLLMFIVVFLPAFCIFVSKNDNLTKKEYI